MKFILSRAISALNALYLFLRSFTENSCRLLFEPAVPINARLAVELPPAKAATIPIATCPIPIIKAPFLSQKLFSNSNFTTSESTDSILEP